MIIGMDGGMRIAAEAALETMAALSALRRALTSMTDAIGLITAS